MKDSPFLHNPSDGIPGDIKTAIYLSFKRLDTTVFCLLLFCQRVEKYRITFEIFSYCSDN
jgi:hypothetical protein